MPVTCACIKIHAHVARVFLHGNSHGNVFLHVHVMYMFIICK